MRLTFLLLGAFAFLICHAKRDLRNYSVDLESISTDIPIYLDLDASLHQLVTRVQSIDVGSEQGSHSTVFKAVLKENEESVILKAIKLERVEEVKAALTLSGTPGYPRVLGVYRVNFGNFIAAFKNKQSANWRSLSTRQFWKTWFKLQQPSYRWIIMMKQIRGPSLYSLLADQPEWFMHMPSVRSGEFFLSIVVQLMYVLNLGTKNAHAFHFDAQLRNIMLHKDISECSVGFDNGQVWELPFGEDLKVRVPASWTCGARLVLVDYGTVILRRSNSAELKFQRKRFTQLRYTNAVTRMLRYAVTSILLDLPCSLTASWTSPSTTNEPMRVFDHLLQLIYAGKGGLSLLNGWCKPYWQQGLVFWWLRFSIHAAPYKYVWNVDGADIPQLIQDSQYALNDALTDWKKKQRNAHSVTIWRGPSTGLEQGPQCDVIVHERDVCGLTKKECEDRHCCFSGDRSAFGHQCYFPKLK